MTTKQKIGTLLISLWFVLLISCVEESSPVGRFPPEWQSSPKVDTLSKGQFTIRAGVVTGGPSPEVFYYFAEENTDAPPEGDQDPQDWENAGWKQITDIANPVQELEGSYWIYAVAKNTQGVERSPLVRATVIIAIASKAWIKNPSVDSTANAGQFRIVPGVADGDPPPEYLYYYAQTAGGGKVPSEGANKEADWLYWGWKLLDVSESLTQVVEAYEYDFYALAINSSGIALRSDKINFDVEGFSPNWVAPPQVTRQTDVFGRFLLESGEVTGNPSPQITYYFQEQEQGAEVEPKPPVGNGASDWKEAGWKFFEEYDVAWENGLLDIGVGRYTLYAVARNRYEPPVRTVPISISLPYLSDDLKVIQTSIPSEWKTEAEGSARSFSDALLLKNDHILLTGRDFDHSYISTDLGKTWEKQTEESGLQGLKGTLLGHGDAIYHFNSEVYKSEDGGKSFSKLATPPWGMREFPVALSWNDRVWIMGGYERKDKKADGVSLDFAGIWYSEDGAESWTRTANLPPWLSENTDGTYDVQSGYSGLIFKNKMWIFPPLFGEPIRYSTDGEVWEEFPLSLLGVRQEYMPTFFGYGEHIWILGDVLDNAPRPVLHYFDPDSEAPRMVKKSLKSTTLAKYSMHKTKTDGFGGLDTPRMAAFGIEDTGVRFISFSHDYDPFDMSDGYGYRAFGLDWVK